MSNIELGYAGIGNVLATFKLDEATKTAIKGEYGLVVGKCVALTGNDAVGFGIKDGSPLFGAVVSADGRGLVTVCFTGFIEGAQIKKFGTTPEYPAIGAVGLGVDISGNIVNLAAGKRGTLTSIASTSGDTSTATILL